MYLKRMIIALLLVQSFQSFVYSQDFNVKNLSLGFKNFSEDADVQRFFVSLTEKTCVSQSDGLMFLNAFLFAQYNNDPKSLIQREFLYQDEISDLDDYMTKGFVSQVIVRILKLKISDLGYLLFRVNRYAYRICNDRGFFQDIRGNAGECLSGLDLISIFKRLEKTIPSDL